MSIKDSQVKIESVDEMYLLAEQVAGELGAGSLVLLEGELGAGKTTFTKGLAKAWGIEEEITSPTFTVVSEYEVKDNSVLEKLVHVDLYRLASRGADDILVKTILEELSVGKRVTVIEWAEKLDKQVAGAVTVKISHGDEINTRWVEVKKDRGQ